MNKLPHVYANTNLNNIKNNETIYYNKDKKVETTNINNKINNLFKSSKYVYKLDVRITTKDKIEVYKIIGKVNDYLITINNEKILIDDIIDIEEV